MTITISPGLEEEIREQAEAEGIAVETYIEQLILEKFHASRIDAEEAVIEEPDSEIHSAVLEGLGQVERGEARPARTVFAELRAKHGLPY